MITIGYSTRTSNPTLQDYFKKSCGLKNVEVIEVINNGEKSLSQVYNEIIDISSNNILVLCHDDIKLETGWGKKILRDFEENPAFSIIGKAGSCYFPESGVYWEKMSQTMVGQVYHHPDGQKKWLSKYSPKLPFLIPVVTIDGLFISFDKTKIKHKFDETIGKFHFYDHGFCIPNYLDGIQIGVTSSFEITHQSIGQPNDEFWSSKNEFLTKWGDKLPLDLKPEKIFVPTIVDKPLKNSGRVAILIPTYEYSETLNDVINSYFEKSNPNLFDIFVINRSNQDITPDDRFTIFNTKQKKLTLLFDEITNKDELTSYEFVFFGRDNIKICNDVITNSLKVFKSFAHTSSVSSRTHYFDNTIMYDGVYIRDNQIAIKSKENYYNFSTTLQEVDSNSSLMTMFRKNTLLLEGCFINTDINGMEDIKFGLKLKNKRYKNFLDGSSVCKEIENKTNKIKILTGFSEKGGSTFAFINLTNKLNENGYDCTLYGPHGWHLDKCKSDLLMNLKLEKNDTVISHFLNLQKRPDVKKIVLSCHEKNLFEVGKIQQFWDEAVFLNQEHKNYHSSYNNKWRIIPNLTQDLQKKDKKDLDKVAGIIGSFDFNKQTHISIQRAIDDGCEIIYLFGEPNTTYFEQYVKQLCNDKVIVKGFFNDKQEMYDMIGRVYSSSISEVASLVKDECELTGTKFFGTSSTSHNNLSIPNEEVINKWIDLLEL